MPPLFFSFRPFLPFNFCIKLGLVKKTVQKDIKLAKEEEKKERKTRTSRSFKVSNFLSNVT